MRLTIAAALLAAANICAAQSDDPFSFRGFKLGGSEDQFVAKLPYFTCRDADKPVEGDRACTADGGPSVMNYGGVRAQSITAHAYRDRVGHVSVVISQCPTEKMTDLQDTLRARLGKPSSDVGFGAGRIVSWEKNAQTIMFTWLATGSVATCSATYESSAFAAERKRRKDGAARERGTGM